MNTVFVSGRFSVDLNLALGFSSVYSDLAPHQIKGRYEPCRECGITEKRSLRKNMPAILTSFLNVDSTYQSPLKSDDVYVCY